MSENTNDVETAASPAFRHVVWRRLRKDKFAMLALCVIAVLFVMSFLAPIIANDKPIFMRWQGRTYLPAVADLFPLKYFVKYTELRQADYRQMRADGTATMLMPPTVTPVYIMAILTRLPPIRATGASVRPRAPDAVK